MTFKFDPCNFGLVVPLVLSITFSGCMTYRPEMMKNNAFLERQEAKQDGNVKVTVAALSDKEGKKIFGTPLAKKGIQPIWIKIENGDDHPYIFLQHSLDPNYYSPAEAAYMSHYSFVKGILGEGLLAIAFFPILLMLPVTLTSMKICNNRMDRAFTQLGLQNDVIMPQETTSGFVFTQLDQGTKQVPVHLVGSDGNKEFTFYVTIPGMEADYMKRDFNTRYSEKDFVSYDEKGLIKALETLDCCVTNEKGNKKGDPLNLVIIGSLEDLLESFATAKWSETQSAGFKSGFMMFKAFIFGQTNKCAPISPLYHNGISQDIAFQKARQKINERLHLRLWYTPMRFNGKPVWVGAVSRDIGVKFTWKTWYMTTHKIDPNIDDARDYVLEDFASVGRALRYGFVEGVGPKDRKNPGRNLTGDPIYTDGFRIGIELSDARTELGSFRWNVPFRRGNLKNS